MKAFIYLSDHALPIIILGIVLMLVGTSIPTNIRTHWAAIYRSIARLIFSLGIALALTFKTPLILLIGVLGNFQDLKIAVSLPILISIAWSSMPLLKSTEVDKPIYSQTDNPPLEANEIEAQQYIKILENNGFVVKRTGAARWHAVKSDETIQVNFYSLQDLANYAKIVPYITGAK
nr:hypothetical protein [uncultured Pseudomonas sp.]